MAPPVTYRRMLPVFGVFWTASLLTDFVTVPVTGVTQPRGLLEEIAVPI